MPPLAKPPVRSDDAVAAASTQRQRPHDAKGGAPAPSAVTPQPGRQSPSLRALLSQQRQQTQQQRQQRQQRQGAPTPAKQQHGTARRAPALTYGQQRQQHEQQQLLQQHFFRQQQLRVPYWVRSLADQLLQARAAAEAEVGAAPPEAAAGTGSGVQGLGAYDCPAAVLDRLAELLPPFDDAAAPAAPGDEQQQQQHEPDQQQQHEPDQQQQHEPDQRQHAELGVAVTTQDGGSATPPTAATCAGEVFASELAAILGHYEQTGAEAGAGAEATAQADALIETASAAVADAGTASAGTEADAGTAAEAGPQGAPGESGRARAAPRQRRVDPGGFLLLLRAVALMGDGMRGAVALLLAADRSGRPVRSHDIVAAAIKLANSLLEDEAAVVLVRLAAQWDVCLDRGMWQNVLDVCAKAGKPQVVQQMMQEQAAAGLPPDSVSHTILVMAHEKAGGWRDALAAFEGMKAAGLQRNSFTYRALVSALVGAGRLRDACAVLDDMAADGVAGNAVVYQTLINAFLERGEAHEVDALLRRMLRDGVRFSHQAVGRLSGFCFGRGQPMAAFQLFKTVREMGLLSLDETAAARAAAGSEQPGLGGEGGARGGRGRSPRPAATASWDGEGGEGGEEGEEGSSMERARMQAAHSYCRMIAACHKARLLDEAWCVYGWMRADGLRPDRAAYSRLISVCAYSPARRAADAEALYARLVAERVDVDAFMYLHLVTALGGGAHGDEGGAVARWPAVLRVLHGMQMRLPNYRDTHVQTVAVSLAARHGRLGDALAVYRLMLQDGVQPRVPTFNALIAACMRAGQPAKGFRFFEVMQAMGVQADVVTVSTLIACCERLGDWRRAEEVWAWMLRRGLEPDTICCNTMISCLERSNQPDRALAVFEQMAASGVAGSSATYAALCDVFAKKGDWAKLRTAVQVKEWMEAQGEDPGQLTQGELARRAGEGGNWARALALFEGMEGSLGPGGSQPNGVTYSAAIVACARLADWRRALELKDRMLASGLPPSAIVFNSVLAACEAAAQLGPALRVLDEMRAAGVPRDQYTYSTLISCCLHDGPDLGRATRLFQEMQDEGLTPNTVVVNALLSVCAAAGDADVAKGVYKHVIGSLRLPPDEITYHCMMEATGRVGRWAEGLRYFVASYETRGSYRGVLQLDLAQPDTAAQLDLHFLSVVGARIVLRGWLLHLRRRAELGERLPAGFKFRIVTGWGRNSANNVPRLKPEVGRMLASELGPPLAASEPESNLGVYHVEREDMYAWLLTQAQLGFSPREEEEAWQQMERLARFQRAERRRPGGARGRQPMRPGQRPPAGGSLPQPRELERAAWSPDTRRGAGPPPTGHAAGGEAQAA